jgi:hypothetical protein
MQLGSQARQASAKFAHTYSEAVKDLASQRGIAEDDLFADFRQGTQELEFRKDGAKLEQLAHQLALSDRKYVEDLQQIGQLRRLEDSHQFALESQSLALGQALEDALAQRDLKVDLNASEREFNEWLTNMDVDSAAAILAANMDANNRALILKAGVGAGEALVKTKSEEPDTTPVVKADPDDNRIVGVGTTQAR